MSEVPLLDKKTSSSDKVSSSSKKNFLVLPHLSDTTSETEIKREIIRERETSEVYTSDDTYDDTSDEPVELVSPFIEEREESIEGYRTYLLYLDVSEDVKNIYAIYGNSEDSLELQSQYTHMLHANVLEPPHPHLYDIDSNIKYSSYFGFNSNLHVIGIDFNDLDDEGEQYIYNDSAIFSFDVPNDLINICSDSAYDEVGDLNHGECAWEGNRRIFFGQTTIPEDIELYVRINVQGKLNVSEEAETDNFVFKNIVFQRP